MLSRLLLQELAHIDGFHLVTTIDVVNVILLSVRVLQNLKLHSWWGMKLQNPILSVKQLVPIL